MPDEQKPDQKSTPLEPSKDIEELLKELPKVDLPKTSTPPPTPVPKPLTPPATQTAPPSLKAPEGTAKPTIPAPILPVAGQDKFKSLVRTMDEDLQAAKKGLRPEPKPFEIKPPPAGPKMAPLAPPLAVRPPPSPEVKLGPAERTKTLEMPKTPLPLAPPPGKKFNVNPKFLIIILLILAASGGAWYFLTKESEETVILVPTITPTPTPAPKALSELITSINQIAIPSAGNFLNALNDKINSLVMTSGGLTVLNIIDENGKRYSISEIFERLNITLPNGLAENLDGSDWILFAYGQQETFDDKGLLIFETTAKAKIGFIAKTGNPDLLRNTLNGWEITMTSDLDNLFGIDPKKATSETFLDNIYGGADIRYRNFSYADNSIDYAIINLSGFNLNYFVLTGSRESIYSAIDLLKNQ